jgi:hypothetical protein
VGWWSVARETSWRQIRMRRVAGEVFSGIEGVLAEIGGEGGGAGSGAGAGESCILVTGRCFACEQSVSSLGQV